MAKGLRCIALRVCEDIGLRLCRTSGVGCLPEDLNHPKP